MTILLLGVAITLALSSSHQSDTTSQARSIPAPVVQAPVLRTAQSQKTITISEPIKRASEPAAATNPALEETIDTFVLPKFTVLALDAGHGGVDPGSIGSNGLTEKEVTLRLAKKVRSRLSSIKNLHIALTRYDDRTLNINSRTEIIETIGADFVLSLHLNSIPQDNITLVESYYKTSRRADPGNTHLFVSSGDEKIALSQALAASVLDSVYATVKRHNEISVNAGLKTDSMRILSQNRIPGALIEVTCLSNPEEENRLASDEYLDKLAAAIAEGIKVFLENTGSSFTASL